MCQKIKSSQSHSWMLTHQPFCSSSNWLCTFWSQNIFICCLIYLTCCSSSSLRHMSPKIPLLGRWSFSPWWLEVPGSISFSACHFIDNDMQYFYSFVVAVVCLTRQTGKAPGSGTLFHLFTTTVLVRTGPNKHLLMYEQRRPAEHLKCSTNIFPVLMCDQSTLIYIFNDSHSLPQKSSKQSTVLRYMCEHICTQKGFQNYSSQGFYNLHINV